MPDPTPSPESLPAPLPPAQLRLTDFSFQYRGAETLALAGVDLVLRAGDAVAVLGPQGAGTSTLARAAAGLLGEHGHSTGVRELPGEDGHGGVGMLGDDPEAQLTGLTRTVHDEAALPGRLSGLPLADCFERAEASLQALGIAGLAERPLATLSGGERQLTALAGLLTLRPDVLVLDQPSQALDASARRRLARSLRAFRDAGGAVLLTGHQHDDLTAACDQVLFLDRGRQVTAGPAAAGAAGLSAEAGGLSPEADGAGQCDQVQADQLRLDDAQLDQHGIWDARRAPARRDEPFPEAAQHGRQVLLSVRELSVQRETTPVLQNLALDLYASEVTALLGANGSGKSTLLSALAGLVPAEPGARITGPGGVALAEVPAHRRAGHLAWVGQDPGDQLSASTVRAELMRAVPLGPGGRRLRREDRAPALARREEQVQEVMELAGLSAEAEEHPYDLVPAQRKDCVIASALLLRPAVLLLDEPTLGRDSAAMTRLSTLVRGFTSAGGAVLVATHDQRWAAEISDRQLRLDAGHLQPEA
ncbi:ATP-binding cassette domain-containing protein [Nesterenkonia sandarakina]|uniref:Energy-coupling factor transport system ATP-binding protein n=1 Tax=Nesterenkonia sandarakina TaxID=272918 RepID=A0A2T0YGL9_9MICC|nr:ABC transporter ATP-binding protein [Nesterenkonia sandarakina]PRZ14076.1 energy-coupling factor transport system ATP-binding protein [Nesterenkonia sandarakina]